MYLSRLTLDPRSAQARRDLGNAYEMHRTLTHAFVSDVQEGRPARFLWRLEAGLDAWATPVVLVQSGVQPEWSQLQVMPNYLQRLVESKRVELDEWVEEGRLCRFRLVANPTVTRQGKRHGLVGEPDQLTWLDRQGERYGFVVDAAMVTASDVLASRKEDARISVQRVCFEGMLKIRQPEALRDGLVSGIGPAKAFGCGLLSLAPC